MNMRILLFLLLLALLSPSISSTSSSSSSSTLLNRMCSSDDRAPSFNQRDLCSASNNSMITPSWCTRHNPFSSVPYLFSDNNFPSWLNVEDGAICNTANPYVFSFINGTIRYSAPYALDGNAQVLPSSSSSSLSYSAMISPRDKCRFISKINTIEFSGEFGFNSSTTIEAKRYLVLGLVSGQIILMNFNKDDEIYLLGNTEDKTNIRTLETLTNGTDLYVSTVSFGNSVSLFYGNSSNIASIQRCGNILQFESRNQFPPDVKLITHDGKIYASLIVYNSTEMCYFIYFYQLDGCSFTKQFQYKVKEKWESNLKFKISTQVGGFDNVLTTNNFVYSRTILQFSTRKHVKIIEMTTQDIEMDLSTNDNSTFYVATDEEEITASTIAYEYIRRIDFTKSSCAKIYANPAQGANLILSLKRRNSNYLKARNLLEFGNYPFYRYSNRTYNNPVGRTVECNVADGTFYDALTQSCTHAFEVENVIGDISIGEEIQELSSRFHDAPLNYSQYFEVDLTEKLDTKDICNNIAQFPALASLCEENLNQTECAFDAFTMFGNKFLPKILADFWVNQIYISKTGKEVLVYGLQQEMCSLNGLYMDNYNTISLMGESTYMDITRNAQHMFVTVSRERWELQSLTRFYNICKQLEVDPEDPFLKPFAEQCKANTPSPVTLNQFGQYTSSCFSGMSCPSLKHVEIDIIPEGFYTTRPNVVKECEEKYFCLQGVRQPCPIGFYCPNKGMTKPLPCKFSTSHNLHKRGLSWEEPKGSDTCYSQANSLPQPCLNGTLCITPYFPPIPISPGLYLEGNKIKECQLGDYCNLGRYIGENQNSSILACPENTYCEEPSTMEPSLCIPDEKLSLYCPPGTTFRRPCNKGFYCPKPSVEVPCKLTQYCEEGSYIPETCPAGYYCPSPSEKLICPKGFYCVVGSVYPTNCPTFSICPEGTKAYEDYALGVLIDILIIMGVILTFKIYSWTSNCYIRYKAKKLKNQQDLELLTIDENDAEYIVVEQKTQKLTLSQCMQGLYKDIGVEISFEDLSVDLKTSNRRILHNLNGKFGAGRLTCIMGPSGSGKTTLLSAISGKASYANISGSIRINGEISSMKKFKNICAFVQQEDCMHRELTVEECIYFSARTRLASQVSQKTVESIVNGVIQILDLENVRHSVIGDENKRGISGGQRKRVSIAMELVACPYVLFLDEPTSSLDAYSSFEVSKAMKDIASSGITVVAVLHQPRFEIFEMFDDVVLLGNGGRIVYMGPSSDALPYFEEKLNLEPPPRVNPSDFFLDAIYDPKLAYESQKKINGKQVQQYTCKEMFDVWENNYKKLDEFNGTDFSKLVMEEKAKSQNPLIHFYMNINRSFLLKIRNIFGFFMDCLLVYVAGLALGLTFLKDAYVGPLPEDMIDSCPAAMRKICEYPLNNPIINMASTIPLALGLCAGMSSLTTFGSRQEQLIFKKERESGLSVLAYFSSKMLEQLPNILLGPIVFLSIFFSLYSPRATFGEYYLVLFLMHFTTFGLGSLVSVVVPLDLIQLATAVSILVSQLVSGSKPTLPQMKKIIPPLFWISCISYIRYAQEALYLIEIKYYKDIFDISSSLEMFDYHLEDLDYCIFMIPVFGIVFRLLTLIVLYQKSDDSLWNTCLMFISYYSNFDHFKTGMVSMWRRIQMVMIWKGHEKEGLL
ncbi:predicted protein [Naegleria gruberi]|uniref:Predicted protein n=1 Tax=Naegleria gruberi TaxID=5762 RepID=D2VPU9_NAEGR|nr:uncharacterized protein NAEGRDRAFT_70994 [Naegleria gruberi]EFC41188.1 predicted protein [Naegleria gruberi]|eukprot:XP_002673932.1 predicted protein [Naegleria gruberi strain NEG-M]